MFWWRGNGLLIGFLASVPAVAATQLGASRPALAYAASAGLIFWMRDTLGAQSSLFSIPTKLWPPLLLLVAILVHFSPSSGQSHRKGNVASQVAEVQRALPRQLNEQLRLDQAQLEGKVLRYNATSLVPLDASGAQRAAHEQAIRQLYCEQSDFLRQAQMDLSAKVTVPPRTLSDRVQTFVVELHPQACPSAVSR